MAKNSGQGSCQIMVKDRAQILHPFTGCFDKIDATTGRIVYSKET